MRAHRLLIALASVASTCLLGACAMCDREEGADGRYNVVTDCTGNGLQRGVLIIGPYGSSAEPYSRSTRCRPEQPDAGGHVVEWLGDGGTLTVPADAGFDDAGVENPGTVVDAGEDIDWPCTTPVVTDDNNACAETVAAGALALGLPSGVRVRNDGDFDLYGKVNARDVECLPESFGDEKMLVCRSGLKVTCFAVLER